MNILNWLSIILVIIIIVSIIVYSLSDKLRVVNEKNKTHEDKLIDKQLQILNSNADPSNQAKAFTKLIRYSYVLMHTLINTGNKYNDSIQTKHFVNSLTNKTIEVLFSLGEKHE